MTDEAPERITTRHYANGIINAADSDKGFRLLASNHIAEAEYLRADLATRQRDEAVGAAWASSATQADEAAEEFDHYAAQSANGADEVARRIRALTPSDATAALECVKRRAWDEAIEAAGYAARSASPVEDDAEGCLAAEQAVLALKKGPDNG